MAMQDFLNLFPDNIGNDGICTGLFRTPTCKRKWSDRPNKCIHGVSWTLYEEAMDITFPDKNGNTESLFSFFHGSCWEYAMFLKKQHPDWKIRCIRRGTFWDPVIHAFCTFTKDGVLHFADARGITYDPKEFFSDFVGGKTMYLESDETISKAVRDTRCASQCLVQAYEKIYVL